MKKKETYYFEIIILISFLIFCSIIYWIISIKFSDFIRIKFFNIKDYKISSPLYGKDVKVMFVFGIALAFMFSFLGMFNKKIYKKVLIFLFGVIFVVFILYYSIINIVVVYDNTIVKYSTFNPTGKIYTYQNIEYVDIGILNDIILIGGGDAIDNYRLKYEVKFDDDFRIDLCNYKYEELKSLDTLLTNEGIKMKINKKNFDKLNYKQRKHLNHFFTN